VVEKDLLFTDYKELIRKRFIESGWVIAYCNEKKLKDVENSLVYSALIAKDKITDSLSKYDWDLRLAGGPGLVFYREGNEEKAKYCRFSEDGIEPLVYYREFHGAKETYLEISEEFRLYFDLYEEYVSNKEKKYIRIDDNGDEEVVAIISENEVKIQIKYLKEYISVRNIVFVVFFDLMRFSEKTLEELSLNEKDKTNKKSYFIYNHLIRNINIAPYKVQSWLFGKVLIPGIKNYKPALFETIKYEKFIVGIYNNGNDKYVSSSKNTLIPVYFKREVLDKYYNDPSKFEVEDGLVRASGLWTLKVDNNNLDYVIVFSKDLGFLPYKEQVYWKSYNVKPPLDKGLSRAAYLRNIMGKFTAPDMPDLYFKEKYNEFTDRWYKKYGWYLFKPLSKSDEHHFKSLHRPSSENRKDFDAQVASLTKIIINSLNEEELVKGIKIEKASPKGIDKFEAFLENHDCKIDEMIKFLRNLQDLRSHTVAHRKSEDEKELRKPYGYFHMDDKHLDKVFDGILVGAIKVLNTLEVNLLAE
jgi:hypothetical protein